MTTASIPQAQPARRQPVASEWPAAVAIPLAEFGQSLANAGLDQWFEAFAERNADVGQYEISNQGLLLIMPPTGNPGYYHETKIVTALDNWSEVHGGIVGGPTGRFLLPDGSRRGPDATWIAEARRAELLLPENRPFPTFAPDFIVEVQSPSNSREELIAKINLFIAYGTKLAWLIDAGDRIVIKFRPGQEPEVLHNPEFVDGDADVLPGFRFAIRQRIFDFLTGAE